MMRRTAVFALTLWCLSQFDVLAQGLRDPTLPPLEVRVLNPEQADPAPGSTSTVMSMIVRNGQRYVAVGTRLYAKGQKLGNARIERIEETEIWLREGGVLRKVSQFTGIERHPSMELPKSGATNPSIQF